eukprot:1160520-Pelagomonas_calceolata.AAC.3
MLVEKVSPAVNRPDSWAVGQPHIPLVIPANLFDVCAMKKLLEQAVEVPENKTIQDDDGQPTVVRSFSHKVASRPDHVPVCSRVYQAERVIYMCVKKDAGAC